MESKPTIGMMVIGTIIFVTVIGAWLYAELHGVPNSAAVIFTFAGPVVTALFLSNRIGQAADAARQAAVQTNGTLDQRVQTAVSNALATRDAARTWQQQNTTVSTEESVLTNPSKEDNQ